jgi:hypothetical protein
MHIANYLGLVHRAEVILGNSFRDVAAAHVDEPDVHILCRTLATQCDAHADKLKPFADHYGEQGSDEPERLYMDLFGGPRTGGLGLLRDLHDLYLMATEVNLSWVVIRQAAQGLHDAELLSTVQDCDHETELQIKWLMTRMKQAAPQTLIVG